MEHVEKTRTEIHDPDDIMLSREEFVLRKGYDPEQAGLSLESHTLASGHDYN